MAEPQTNEAEQAEVDTSVLHPLESEWTLWYDRRASTSSRAKGEKDSYEANLQEVGTFGSVEDFWRYFNHIAKPSQLTINSNYHLFKKGVKPLWEDQNNVNGGKWVIELKSDAKQILDILWQNIILSLIGETLELEDSNELCGCVFSRRKMADRIAIWNRSKINKKFIDHLGNEIRQLILLHPHIASNKINLSYQNHSDAMKTGASYTNPQRYRKDIR
eukprot:TRINITY_DN1040_c0_g1_i2.p1 TRINITY_DN1040_c0_g1~~TRINITY_DN1040_c0_g1_i2.p1  ORF type:complete len:238 (-),score=48.99 TRINITY_DN1040_c0_g1_i2:117-770(-)